MMVREDAMPEWLGDCSRGADGTTDDGVQLVRRSTHGWGLQRRA